MSDSKLFIRASLGMYRDCCQAASRGCWRNILVVPAAILMMVLFLTLAGFIGNLGILGGFILGFIACLFIAQYYSWLSRTREGEHIQWRSLVVFDFGIFQAVISALFIIWIAKWLLDSLLLGIQEASWIRGLFNLAILLIFNALAEVVYIRGNQDLSAFQRAYEFTRDHWPEWFLPYIILFAPLLLSGSIETALAILLATNVMFPTSLVIQTIQHYIPNSWPALILSVVAAHWLMLFRAELFEALESGNRRMRMYKYKIQ